MHNQYFNKILVLANILIVLPCLTNRNIIVSTCVNRFEISKIVYHRRHADSSEVASLLYFLFDLTNVKTKQKS